MTISAEQLVFVILLLNAAVVAIAMIQHQRLWPLTAFLILLASHMGFNLTGLADRSEFQWLTKTFSLFYGPLFYLFVLSLTRVHFKRHSQLQWFGGLLMLVVLNLYLVDNEQVSIIMTLSLVLVFIVLSVRRIIIYHRVLEQTQSNTVQRLDWLYYLIVLLLLATITEFSRYGFLIWGFGSYAENAFILTIGFLILFVVTLTIKAIHSASVLIGITREEELYVQPVTSIDSELMIDADKIKAVMTSQKLYLESDLTIARLAECCAIPARDASAAINAVFNMNFNEFVNRFRIQYVCDALRQGCNRTHLELMLEAGFNSKSSFNEAFKRFTQLTPSQYRSNLPVLTVEPEKITQSV